MEKSKITLKSIPDLISKIKNDDILHDILISSSLLGIFLGGVLEGYILWDGIDTNGVPRDGLEPTTSQEMVLSANIRARNDDRIKTILSSNLSNEEKTYNIFELGILDNDEISDVTKSAFISDFKHYFRAPNLMTDEQLLNMYSEISTFYVEPMDLDIKSLGRTYYAQHLMKIINLSSPGFDGTPTHEITHFISGNDDVSGFSSTAAEEGTTELFCYNNTYPKQRKIMSILGLIVGYENLFAYHTNGDFDSLRDGIKSYLDVKDIGIIDELFSLSNYVHQMEYYGDSLEYVELSDEQINSRINEILSEIYINKFGNSDSTLKFLNLLLDDNVYVYYDNGRIKINFTYSDTGINYVVSILPNQLENIMNGGYKNFLDRGKQLKNEYYQFDDFRTIGVNIINTDNKEVATINLYAHGILFDSLTYEAELSDNLTLVSAIESAKRECNSTSELLNSSLGNSDGEYISFNQKSLLNGESNLEVTIKKKYDNSCFSFVKTIPRDSDYSQVVREMLSDLNIQYQDYARLFLNDDISYSEITINSDTGIYEVFYSTSCLSYINYVSSFDEMKYDIYSLELDMTEFGVSNLRLEYDETCHECFPTYTISCSNQEKTSSIDSVYRFSKALPRDELKSEFYNSNLYLQGLLDKCDIIAEGYSYNLHISAFNTFSLDYYGDNLICKSVCPSFGSLFTLSGFEETINTFIAIDESIAAISSNYQCTISQDSDNTIIRLFEGKEMIKSSVINNDIEFDASFVLSQLFATDSKGSGHGRK